jgi:hypothetical protein
MDLLKKKESMKVAFTIIVKSVEKTGEAPPTQMLVAWKRGTKKENKGQTPLTKVSKDGSLSLKHELTLNATLQKISNDSFEGKLVTFTLKDVRGRFLCFCVPVWY